MDIDTGMCRACDIAAKTMSFNYLQHGSCKGGYGPCACVCVQKLLHPGIPICLLLGTPSFCNFPHAGPKQHPEQVAITVESTLMATYHPLMLVIGVQVWVGLAPPDLAHSKLEFSLSRSFSRNRHSHPARSTDDDSSALTCLLTAVQEPLRS